jgi:flagellar motor protein MotB
MVACAGTGGMSPQSIARVDQARESPAAKHASTRAPQAFAIAEQRRKEALAAHASGDALAAELLEERAVAAYRRAVVLAGAADAQRALDDASAAMSKAEGQLRELAAGRASAESDALELEAKLKVARNLLTPTPSGAAGPEREAARATVARSILTQAALLCSAARLVTPTPDATTSEDAEIAKVTAQLDTPPSKTTPSPSAIDAAAHARNGCLAALTRTRRLAKDTVSGQGDALLAEVSTAGMTPTRDERGVVVTLHDAFTKGSEPTADAKEKLEVLGRVAAAHAGVGVQIVNHDAVPADAQASLARAESAAAILLSTGAPKDRTKAESAGTRAPIVDPRDAARRGRNARLEVVFVTPGR